MPTLISPYHLDEPLEILPVTGRGLDVAPAEGELPDRLVALYDGVADAVATALADADAGARADAGADTAGPVVVASGDCNTSLGVLAGLQRAGVDPSIVWFDAHGDFNTPATTPSGYLGGMALSLLVGQDDLGLAAGVGLTAIDEGRVVLVDARDLDPAERDALERSAVTRLPVADLDGTTLPEGPIYLHLDVDVVDAGACPDLRFPAGGGPSRDEVVAAVQRVLDSGRVVAVGLACTWTPDGLRRAEAADLVARLGLATRPAP